MSRHADVQTCTIRILRAFGTVGDALGTRVGVDASLELVTYEIRPFECEICVLIKSERRGMDVLVVAHHKSKGFGWDAAKVVRVK